MIINSEVYTSSKLIRENNYHVITCMATFASEDIGI